jgi:hypothetical protein
MVPSTKSLPATGKASKSNRRESLLKNKACTGFSFENNPLAPLKGAP